MRTAALWEDPFPVISTINRAPSTAGLAAKIPPRTQICHRRLLPELVPSPGWSRSSESPPGSSGFAAQITTSLVLRPRSRPRLSSIMGVFQVIQRHVPETGVLVGWNLTKIRKHSFCRVSSLKHTRFQCFYWLATAPFRGAGGHALIWSSISRKSVPARSWWRTS